MFGLGLVINGTLSLAEFLADKTENEVDDRIVDALKLIADGKLAGAVKGLLAYAVEQTDNKLDDKLFAKVCEALENEKTA